MKRRGTPEADLQRAVVRSLRQILPRIAIIHHGRQVYLGTLEELKAAYPDQTLENIFLEITEHA